MAGELVPDKPPPRTTEQECRRQRGRGNPGPRYEALRCAARVHQGEGADDARLEAVALGLDGPVSATRASDRVLETARAFEAYLRGHDDDGDR